MSLPKSQLIKNVTANCRQEMLLKMILGLRRKKIYPKISFVNDVTIEKDTNITTLKTKKSSTK